MSETTQGQGMLGGVSKSMRWMLALAVIVALVAIFSFLVSIPVVRSAIGWADETKSEQTNPAAVTPITTTVPVAVPADVTKVPVPTIESTRNVKDQVDQGMRVYTPEFYRKKTLAEVNSFITYTMGISVGTGSYPEWGLVIPQWRGSLERVQKWAEEDRSYLQADDELAIAKLEVVNYTENAYSSMVDLLQAIEGQDWSAVNSQAVLLNIIFERLGESFSVMGEEVTKPSANWVDVAEHIRAVMEAPPPTAPKKLADDPAAIPADQGVPVAQPATTPVPRSSPTPDVYSFTKYWHDSRSEMDWTTAYSWVLEQIRGCPLSETEREAFADNTLQLAFESKGYLVLALTRAKEGSPCEFRLSNGKWLSRELAEAWAETYLVESAVTDALQLAIGESFLDYAVAKLAQQDKSVSRVAPTIQPQPTSTVAPTPQPQPTSTIAPVVEGFTMSNGDQKSESGARDFILGAINGEYSCIPEISRETWIGEILRQARQPGVFLDEVAMIVLAQAKASSCP